jgi:hypothetical protein
MMKMKWNTGTVKKYGKIRKVRHSEMEEEG